ncbi:MAG: DEAD/DEAH box helicase family protein [Nitrosomonadaceae bacterium]
MSTPSVKIKKAEWARTPRKWQKAAYSIIRKHFAGPGPEHAIVSAVMGSGKSDIISEVSTSVELKPKEVVLISTNTIALVDSLYKRINAKVPGKVGRFYSYAKDINSINVVCNDSLANFIKEAELSGHKVVFFIIDEAHESETDYFLSCIERLNTAVLGLTGTAFRTDETHRLSIFKKLIFRYGVAEAIKDGVVVDWLIKNNIKGGKTNNEVCMQMIKKEPGQGISNAINQKDAKNFSDYLNKHGVTATYIHSNLPRSEILRRTEDFAAGKYKCMVHVGLLKNGVDIPFITWSMLRRNTSSRLRFIQEVGRLLRTHKDKLKAVFLDPQDLFGRFDISPEEALGYYEVERTRIGTPMEFSEFERFVERDSFETVLAIENLIRNIQVKLSLYGFNLNRQATADHLTMKNRNLLFQHLGNRAGLDDPQWKKFFAAVERRIDKLHSGYCNCLLKIINAIEIIGFYPSFDGKALTIELTQAQQELLFAFNKRGETKLLTYDGSTKGLCAWAKATKQAKTTLLWRYREGWSDSEIINGRAPTEDLLGKEFGLWTVVGKSGRGKWLCKCACGNPSLSAIQKNHLYSKRSQSCGCKIVEHRTASIGDKNSGENHYSTKMTEDDVKVIWERLRGESPTIIAEDYPIHATAISNIKLQRSWKDVTKKLKPHLCIWQKSKCRRKTEWRGLCKQHYVVAKREGILDEVSIPKERPHFKDVKLAVKSRIQIGVCRVAQDGKGCRTVELTRGLCHRHYEMCKTNNVMDEFAAKSIYAVYTVEDLTLNPSHKVGVCKLNLRGEPCKRVNHGRGLCSPHYTWLKKRGLLEKFADPSSRINAPEA